MSKNKILLLLSLLFVSTSYGAEERPVTLDMVIKSGNAEWIAQWIYRARSKALGLEVIIAAYNGNSNVVTLILEKAGYRLKKDDVEKALVAARSKAEQNAFIVGILEKALLYIKD